MGTSVVGAEIAGRALAARQHRDAGLAAATRVISVSRVRRQDVAAAARLDAMACYRR